MNPFTFTTVMRSKPSPVLPGTIGLVLCGGQSSRMGADKSLLVYHDKPQRYHVYEMLQSVCGHVYISCRHSQAEGVAPGYHCLTDDHRYHHTGPMAALLTAFEKFPGKHVLLVGCDYPFLRLEELQDFCGLLPAGKPVAFYNEAAGLFEPLLAWYPYSCYKNLQVIQQQHQYSLKHFLMESEAVAYIPADKNSIRSVDTEEDFDQVKGLIRGGL